MSYQETVDQHFGENYPLKLLKIMLQDQGLLNKIKNVLTPSNFSSKRTHITICSELYKFYEVNGYSPTIDMLEQLVRDQMKEPVFSDEERQAHAVTWNEFKTMALRPEEIPFFHDRLKGYIRRQSIIYMQQYLTDELNRNGLDVDVDKIEDKVKTIVGDTHSFVNNTPPGLDYFSSLDVRLMRYRELGEANPRVVCTLVKGVDQHLKDYGVSEKQLSVIMAGTGVGKTHWMVWVSAAALYQSKFVIYFSLGDMDEYELGARFDSKISGIPYQYLKEIEHEKTIRTAYDRLKIGFRGNLMILADAPNKLNIHDVKAIVRDIELQKQRKCDLLVIDYGTQLKPVSSWKDFRHHESQKFVDMKSLSSELSIPIWTGVQANREALSRKTLALENIAESYAIAHVAHLILAISQSSEENEVNEARLVFLKNRGGPTGPIIPVTFRKDISHFSSGRETEG